jgi:hypothetical protein
VALLFIILLAAVDYKDFLVVQMELMEQDGLILQIVGMVEITQAVINQVLQAL